MTLRIATGTILRVIDGDTFVVTALDPGWGVSLQPTHSSDNRCHIRLNGINCPDGRTNAKWYDPILAQTARSYMIAAYPAGTQVVLTSHGFDSFGRTIADATVNGVDLAQDLIDRGYARTGDYPSASVEN